MNYSVSIDKNAKYFLSSLHCTNGMDKEEHNSHIHTLVQTQGCTHIHSYNNEINEKEKLFIWYT